MDEDDLLRRPTGSSNYGPAGLQNIRRNFPQRGRARSQSLNPKRFAGQLAANEIQNRTPRNRASHSKEPKPKQLFLRKCRNHNISEQMDSTNMTTSKNRQDRAQRDDNKIRRMGFLTLEALVKSDVKDILANLNAKKEGFLNLLQSPIDRADVHVLIMELLSKICESSFHQLKLTVLLDVCNSQFIGNFKNYLLDLPYVENKSANNKYWKNEIEFWKNFIMFCESIIVMSPTTALTKCRSLIDGSSKCCLEGLRDRHNFTLPEEYSMKLIQLRESLTAHEKDKTAKEERKLVVGKEEQEPPENFRDLSVVPCREDLIEDRPYLRENVISGSYRNVEHYLDVQFRLLREDCFGPLRGGILQFMRDPTKMKYDNIRVYHNVKFVESYISPQKIGSVVEVDDNTKKRFKKMNWAYSKRFIYGTLLLFTKDKCNTFIVATIIEQNIKYLENGKIPVSIFYQFDVGDNLYGNQKYTMFESEVYFEPYYHILRALQDPTFPEHLAMKKYVVDVDPEPAHPAYLQVDKTYNVKISFSKRIKFNVLDYNTWPSSDDLGFNQSQYEAYKTALTREFALIQGPPGTGKTFLGIKIAQTLLTNINKPGCVLLLVCFTNHALDQFLEGLIPVTDSIVRIGGQSRNEALQQFNLSQLRNKSRNGLSNAHRLFRKQKNELESNILELKAAQYEIDFINESIISYTSMAKYVPECSHLEELYKTTLKSGKDPLSFWLFENLVYDFKEPITKEGQAEDFLNTEFMENRNQVILDDFEVDSNMLSNSNIKKAFSLKIAKSQLIYSIQQYLNTDLNCALKRNLHFHIVALRAKIKRFTEMKSYDLLGIRTTPVDLRNLRNLPMVDRWLLYFRWTKIITNKLKEDIRPLQESVLNSNTAYEESRTLLDVELLQKVKVIGMTTSGAARLRKLITVLAPPVVIVEEAAEVLEQHIVTSLTKSCEHLILIGDHQQLRPSAANLRLAKHYSLEVSLFERMILNGVHSRRLSVQHRMRPRISALIVPHIYTELLDHPSVAHFPDVRGITDNVFFFTHGYHEEVVEDSSSKTNKEEADLTLSFANYIMQQGYQPQDVTILAAYSGQMFYFRKQRPLYAHLSKVKITVLDNYQGEESKIILLSLVRSNEQKNIGFLGSKNRICLALSRAKEGFYIFGNIDILKENSNLWTKIAETLENQGSLGTSIRLKCQNHPDQITTISSVKDFSKVPEGGCLLKCNYNLPCLHACPLVCHGYDPGHATIICAFQCERIICELSHVCPLMCREKCKPCKQKITKTLPCGHDMEIFCHLKPQDPSIKCLTTVSVILPECGHEVKKSCYMETRDVACPLPCGLRVQRCGHTCVRTCHVGDDPDHERYICSKPCVKAKKGCTMDLEEGDRGDHQCRKQCHETCDDCNIKVLKKRSSCKHREHIACSKNVDETPCGKKCARTLPCGHFCMKKCFENCGDCKIKVKKVIPECGHEAEMACGARAARAQCGRPCERRLRCGHACRQRCRDACDAALCAELVPRQFDSPCGHRVQLPCNIYSAENGFPSHETLLKHCRAVCGAELVCEHICAGNCASCLHGRLHQPCKQPCKQMNICGHECEEPCNEVCPPCNKVCEMKCVHARCPLPCGSPCVSCKEQCTRACEHGRCSQLCGEQCSRAGCSRPCPLQLACGHACRGLCGERCPDICKICRPDDFPRDFLGDEFDDEALFVVLEDCGHIMEFEYMEHLMNLESEPITLHACSLCRKPIINTPRYKDLVNKRMKTDINPIKERVYGNVQKNLDTKNRLLQEILKFQTAHENLLSDILYSDLKNAFIELKHFVQKYKKNNSLLQLNMHFLYLNILEMMANICKKFKTAKLTELQDDLVKNISLISGFMRGNVRKISQQQQMDIRNEIKRLDSIIQLSKLLSSQNYKISCVSDPKVNEAMAAAKEMVLGIGIYKEDNAINALKLFEDVIKASGIVTKTERDMIVRAIGAKAGQWYKCRNGHFYSINQCGGAMVVGKCIECKAPIGGTNHRLLEDNKHAPEIDNSNFPAWSEEANNMANFDFDDLW